MGAEQRSAPRRARRYIVLPHPRLVSVLCACLFVLIISIGCIQNKQPKPTTRPVTPVSEKQPATIDEAMTLLDHRADWTELPQLNVPRYPAEQFLKNLTIVIDP